MSEQDRKATAKKLGLPEDATWADINKHIRKAIAKKLGLPEDATWADINKHMSEQHTAEEIGEGIEDLTQGEVGKALNAITGKGETEKAPHALE